MEPLIAFPPASPETGAYWKYEYVLLEEDML
jgi:hypothetical protein